MHRKRQKVTNNITITGEGHQCHSCTFQSSCDSSPLQPADGPSLDDLNAGLPLIRSLSKQTKTLGLHVIQNMKVTKQHV